MISTRKSRKSLRHAHAITDMIMEARKADGNEGLTVNDVLPDFIRVRGAGSPNWEYSSSIGGFNWGPLLSAF